jgi:hypothetical protein
MFMLLAGNFAPNASKRIELKITEIIILLSATNFFLNQETLLIVTILQLLMAA